MAEVASVQFGPKLRETFATILVFNRPNDPLKFWTDHVQVLSEDYMKKDKVTHPTPSIIATVRNWKLPN